MPGRRRGQEGRKKRGRQYQIEEKKEERRKERITGRKKEWRRRRIIRVKEREGGKAKNKGELQGKPGEMS